MTLLDAEEGKEYIVKGIATDDEELEAFLFSLGCYSGEPINGGLQGAGRLYRFHQRRPVQY